MIPVWEQESQKAEWKSETKQNIPNSSQQEESTVQRANFVVPLAFPFLSKTSLKPLSNQYNQRIENTVDGPNYAL